MGGSMNAWLKSLPKKRMAAGALFFNESGEVLIVRPSYKDHWSIPGGVVDEYESPLTACIREVKEEIGIDVPSVSFLGVDYTHPTKNRDDSLQFIFNGGVLSKEQIDAISIDGEEIIDLRFVTPERAIELFGGMESGLGRRVHACLQAIDAKKGVYIEGSEC
jgi:8-oxo-dGTP pyrophosphatase MutT (NUDIX family)